MRLSNFKAVTFPVLHTVAGPALRAAGKTYLSYRNDTIIVIFCAANTNKDDANSALASSNN